MCPSSYVAATFVICSVYPMPLSLVSCTEAEANMLSYGADMLWETPSNHAVGFTSSFIYTLQTRSYSMFTTVDTLLMWFVFVFCRTRHCTKPAVVHASDKQHQRCCSPSLSRPWTKLYLAKPEPGDRLISNTIYGFPY